MMKKYLKEKMRGMKRKGKIRKNQMLLILLKFYHLKTLIFTQSLYRSSTFLALSLPLTFKNKQYQ